MKPGSWTAPLLVGALVLLGSCVDFDEGEKTYCRNHPAICAPVFEATPTKVAYVEKKGTLSFHAVAKDPGGDALAFTWAVNVGTFGAARDTATTTDITWTAPECVPPEGATFTLTARSVREASASVTFAAIGLPECPTMTETDGLPAARSGHTATLLYSGNVLVTGGESSGAVFGNSDLYSPREQSWLPEAGLPTARVEHAAVRLSAGEVLIIGGRNANGVVKAADLYHPDQHPPLVWTAAPSPTTGRYGHAAVLMSDSRVLVTGGTDGAALVPTAEIYTPPQAPDWTAKWHVTRNPPVARDHPVATTLGEQLGLVLVTGGTTGAGQYPSSADVFDSASETWFQIDSMGEGRLGHTATLLPSGLVLVTGGINEKGALASSVLIDVPNRQVVTAGSLATARYGHTATLLLTGQVLVTGGRDASGAAITSAELFDPETKAWTATKPLVTARHGHAAVLMATGKVLMVGGIGVGGALSSVEVYDPGTLTWTPTALMPVARERTTATRLESGNVLVIGGRNETPVSTTTLSVVGLYDAVKGTWSSLAAMPASREDHTATLLPSGKVLVVGGSDGTSPVRDVVSFEPALNSWGSEGQLAQGRTFHTTTLLPSGTVLVVGGRDGAGALATVESYVPGSKEWKPAQPMNEARWDHTETLLPSGKVLVTGGYSLVGGKVTPLRSAEVYDPDKNTWTPVASMADLRGGHTATLLRTGKVLVAGGYKDRTPEAPKTLASAELFDPASGTWTSVGALAENRGGHTATLLDSGQVLVAGGHGGFDDLYFISLCELFDPVTQEWTAISSLMTPREDPVVALLRSGKVLMVGGHGYDLSQVQTEVFMP